MTKVTIYQPAKTAMQSGMAKTKRWKLEFKPSSALFIEPLMGWVGQRDTQQQVNLFFDSKEQAVMYAEEHALNYTIIEPHHRQYRPKSYADNFRTDKP